MPRFRRALMQLGLALINATLLLALALAVVVWQITLRLDHLATITVDRLEARLALPELAPRLARIEARLADGADPDAPGTLASLQEDLAQLRRAAQVDGQLARAIAAALVDELVARIAPRDPG